MCIANRAASAVYAGDLITYVGKNGSVHSGVLVSVKTSAGSQNWVRSKFGKTTAFDVAPEKMSQAYSYDSIQIWRKKPALEN